MFIRVHTGGASGETSENYEAKSRAKSLLLGVSRKRVKSLLLGGGHYWGGLRYVNKSRVNAKKVVTSKSMLKNRIVLNF